MVCFWPARRPARASRLTARHARPARASAVETLLRRARGEGRRLHDPSRRGRRLPRPQRLRQDHHGARCSPACSSPRPGTSNTAGATSAIDLVAFRRELGYIPEEPYLYPFLSGSEYLYLIGRLREMPEALLTTKIEGFLELFGLSAAADQAICVLLEGDAAEDRHLGRAAARSDRSCCSTSRRPGSTWRRR